MMKKVYSFRLSDGAISVIRKERKEKNLRSEAAVIEGWAGGIFGLVFAGTKPLVEDDNFKKEIMSEWKEANELKLREFKELEEKSGKRPVINVRSCIF